MMQQAKTILKQERTKFKKDPRYVHLRSEGLSTRRNAASKYFAKYEKRNSENGHS